MTDNGIFEQVDSAKVDTPLGLWCVMRYMDHGRLAIGESVRGWVSPADLETVYFESVAIADTPSRVPAVHEVLSRGNGRYWLQRSGDQIHYFKPGRMLSASGDYDYVDNNDMNRLTASARLRGEYLARAKGGADDNESI